MNWREADQPASRKTPDYPEEQGPTYERDIAGRPSAILPENFT
jgi:hypothetical protein